VPDPGRLGVDGGLRRAAHECTSGAGRDAFAKSTPEAVDVKVSMNVADVEKVPSSVPEGLSTVG